MFKITGSKIILTKADTAEIEIQLEDDEILSTDVITMTVRQTAGSTASITKTANMGTITLLSSDTSSLTTGIYIYDIKFVRDAETSTVMSGFFELVDYSNSHSGIDQHICVSL